jgi:hypothetical protein
MARGNNVQAVIEGGGVGRDFCLGVRFGGLSTVGLGIGHYHTMMSAKPFWWAFATLINSLSSSVQDAAPVV